MGPASKWNDFEGLDCKPHEELGAILWALGFGTNPNPHQETTMNVTCCGRINDPRIKREGFQDGPFGDRHLSVVRNIPRAMQRFQDATWLPFGTGCRSDSGNKLQIVQCSITFWNRLHARLELAFGGSGYCNYEYPWKQLVQPKSKRQLLSLHR